MMTSYTLCQATRCLTPSELPSRANLLLVSAVNIRLRTIVEKGATLRWSTIPHRVIEVCDELNTWWDWIPNLVDLNIGDENLKEGIYFQ